MSTIMAQQELENAAREVVESWQHGDLADVPTWAAAPLRLLAMTLDNLTAERQASWTAALPVQSSKGTGR